MTAIAAAVAPFKAEYIARTVESFAARVERTLSELADAGFDANILAPYPNTGCGKKLYRERVARYNFVRSITTSDVTSHCRRFGAPDIRRRDDDKIAALVQQVAAMAGDSYDAYARKLESKVGEHVAAEMDYASGSLWSGSIISVTKPDGSVERWKTQIIINFSVYGTPFNQWPTRKLK